MKKSKKNSVAIYTNYYNILCPDTAAHLPKVRRRIKQVRYGFPSSLGLLQKSSLFYHALNSCLGHDMAPMALAHFLCVLYYTILCSSPIFLPISIAHTFHRICFIATSKQTDDTNDQPHPTLPSQLPSQLPFFVALLPIPPQCLPPTSVIPLPFHL